MLNTSNATFSLLKVSFMDRDIDGLTERETVMMQYVYGPNEERWRSAREFFEFVCSRTADKSVRLEAAKGAVKAAKNAGETSKTVCAYVRRFIIPNII